MVFREEPLRRRVGSSHLHPNDRMLESRVTVGARREPKMSATHEPSQLLEPSNLLEPIDLSERQLNFEYPSARSDRGGTSQRGSTRATRREFIPRPTEGRDRSPLKSILMVAGALACFGAGTAMPQFQTLVFGNLKSGQTV